MLPRLIFDGFISQSGLKLFYCFTLDYIWIVWIFATYSVQFCKNCTFLIWRVPFFRLDFQQVFNMDWKSVGFIFSSYLLEAKFLPRTHYINYWISYFRCFSSPCVYYEQESRHSVWTNGFWSLWPWRTLLAWHCIIIMYLKMFPIFTFLTSYDMLLFNVLDFLSLNILFGKESSDVYLL